MVTRYRISLDFINAPDADLDVFAASVITHLTGNAAFPTPPVNLPTLENLRQTFHAALNEAALGGMHLTAAKDVARMALEDALRATALYVQTHAATALEVLLTSGFFAASTNRVSAPLDAPGIVELDTLGG